MVYLNDKNVEVFKNIIPDILKCPINVGARFARPVEKLIKDPVIRLSNDQADYLSCISEELTDYFAKVHSWFPANPNNKNAVERSRELFVEEITKNGMSSGLPSRRIANFITNKESDDPSQWHYSIETLLGRYDHLFVVGKKGIGKTTFFNYWLNNRSDYLESKRKIIWFRTDVSKLYDLWINNNNKTPKNFSLENYHKLHAIYVVFKYGEDKHKSKAIFRAFKKLNSDVASNQSLLDAFNEIKNIIIRTKKAGSRKNTQRFIDLAVNEPRIIKMIDELYSILSNYWKQEEYTILYILDGADNVSWARGDSDYFEKVCQELANLFVTDSNPEYVDNCKIMIVVRPETFSEIRCRASDHLNTDISSHGKKIFVIPTSPDTIILHKAQVISKPESSQLKEFKATLLNNIKLENDNYSEINIEKNINKFITYSDGYIEKLSKAISDRYELIENYIENRNNISTPVFSSIDFVDKNELISILFHDNIRAFVDNFVKNYTTVILADEKKIAGAQNPDRYPQYLLLNGRTFLDSPDVNWRVRGESYPNIFWWKADWENSTDGEWYGLVTVRALQLLRFHPDLPGKKVNEIVQELFGFGSGILEHSLDRLIKYGLIEINENRSHYAPESLGKSLSAEMRYPLKLTQKGEFYLDYIFMYTDWLYFCGLDTPIPEGVASDSRQVRIHRDLDYTFVRRFNEAYIVTTITFVRMILTQEKKDHEKLSKYFERDKSVDSIRRIFENKNGLIKAFSIPEYLSWVVQEDLGKSFERLNRIKFSKKEGESGRDIALKLYMDMSGLFSILPALKE